ncbi:hypothetical protein FQA47_016799 [Oryzias melastigma]|uniref:Uncharacterized protein n=1 Tax=Oryzias melastigma TaxID=30732 RepID=A0A834C590_ORYME|nr:hypothetical protein FQA47_016799 [Oryzias melastigma]
MAPSCLPGAPKLLSPPLPLSTNSSPPGCREEEEHTSACGSTFFPDRSEESGAARSLERLSNKSLTSTLSEGVI